MFDRLCQHSSLSLLPRAFCLRVTTALWLLAIRMAWRTCVLSSKLGQVKVSACAPRASCMCVCFVVQEFPEPLCGLPLVLLDLTNNCLRRLPLALGHMTSLRSLPLDGNPLKLMRRELWAGAACNTQQTGL